MDMKVPDSERSGASGSEESEHLVDDEEPAYKGGMKLSKWEPIDSRKLVFRVLLKFSIMKPKIVKWIKWMEKR